MKNACKSAPRDLLADVCFARLELRLLLFSLRASPAGHFPGMPVIAGANFIFSALERLIGSTREGPKKFKRLLNQIHWQPKVR